MNELLLILQAASLLATVLWFAWTLVGISEKLDKLLEANHE